jgi:methylase of polypeptide subunit release factors
VKPDREDRPLALDNADEARRLREALDRAGYDPPRIAALLKVKPRDLLAFHAIGKVRVLFLRRTAGGAELDALVRLFLLGEAVEAGAARRALAPSKPEHWLAAGLLEERDGGVAAALQLVPFERLVLAVDPWWGEMTPQYVLGVSSPSLDLAQMTVRRPARSALDVGSGCGIQAFLAAPHSGEVVGVDRNPRAVHVATFNARLNGLANTAFVEGDLYGPVRDRRFDLIVANPPYVISPESRFLYRDSGLGGDEIARRVVREGAGLLEEGGFLQLTCEWAHLTGQDWRGRLADWFGGSGCDAWVMRFTTLDAATHAEHWLQASPHDPAEALPARLEEWLDHHRRLGIEAVSDGVITLRKRSGASNWLRFDDAPQRIGPCGAAVERGFAAADFLTATRDDDALLGARLRLAPDVCQEQRLAPTADGWEVRHSLLAVATGLAYRGEMDRRGVALVDRCRGDKTVREVLDSLAEPGAPPLDPSQALAVVRQLVEQGFLLPG